MKKSERLNQMLRFINQKQRFMLQDLMQEFHISKRTALRDISSLEEIGAPIYVEYGRYGGYYLLNQMTLPPISFNSQEIYALYFAMQALRSFSDLPFQVSFHSIHEKFINALAEKQRQHIERIQDRVIFRNTEQIKESEHLETLLLAAIKQEVLNIYYQTTQQEGTRSIQPIAIYAMKGYWYCQAYDVTKQAYRVFRCDRITSVEITNTEPLIDLTDINVHNAHSLWKPSEHAVKFKCLIDQDGVAHFQQQQFPSMELITENESNYIVGWYEPNEVEFIVNYLVSYGKSINIVEPIILKEHLRKYYKDVLDNL
ncbi:helix-turn-helix transcriptional regulator [Paenibacillus segetis]|uniref:DNA-binding transcriptional regulator n=1 Tax=Paenibacillus segetis TaxID=1325360 RepID=A0ABQ1YEP6_9BACL|nr:YafY family protein [Paenibacillus segetis]GGH23445.1 DNA-binding transcriptional regulator [Paenibacillus segetis]